jgi:hypothetical protein
MSWLLQSHYQADQENKKKKKMFTTAWEVLYVARNFTYAAVNMLYFNSLMMGTY